MTYQAQKNFHTISDFTKCCWLLMSIVGLIDIQHMQAVIKGFFFPKILLLFQWSGNPVTAKARVKIKLFTIPFQFYSPNGTLKIKTGLPTSPISQRALITHGPLITKIPAFDPNWSFSAKCCQSVIIVYWHNCLKANLKHCRKDDW